MFSQALADRDYLPGSAFSGADIAIGHCCNWAAYTGLIEDHPRLVDYYARLRQRPGHRRAYGT
jgi:glutathione S-transferase